MNGPQRIGRYEIHAVIAKGPDATVCRGMDPGTRREVALKFLSRAHVQPGALVRIQHGAAALARLRHPAIAAFHEVVEAGQAVCVVSELAAGKPLAELQKGAAPDMRRAWDIARQVLDALAAAHGKGIVHGDLRPANLFLDAQARVVITDLGVWGLVKDEQALPHYCAPEHLGLGEITARTDLYQMAVIVYELVTGKLPFTGTREEIVHRLLQERPADPSSYMGRVSWQLDWVIQRALSKDPGDRFATATEFADALRSGLEEALGDSLAATAATAWPAAPLETPPPVAAPAPRVASVAPPPQSALVEPKPTRVAAQPKPTPPADAPMQPITSSQAAAELVHKAKAVGRTVAATAKGPDRRVRVLFVDDEERILAGLRALFRHEYNVLITDAPQEALALVKRHGIQVVVSDQRMPGMTGVELLRRVKEQAPQAVRILLTGYTDLAALVGSINQGEIFRFVKKPWDNEELRQVLSDAAKIAAELADVQAPAPESPRSAGSILVIDPQQGLARGLQRLLAGRATVRLASSALEAVKLLDNAEIAAIVADLDAGRDHLVSLFKLLKKQRPEILSILVTDQPDSELAVELLNNAQIFRFMAKPVSGRELRGHVSAALRRYATLKTIPSLLEQVGATKAEAVSA
ncbi:MAG TPA: response regulator [Usitatibacter sp.]|nr:response regulator [Usitatibacter sp.]